MAHIPCSSLILGKAISSFIRTAEDVGAREGAERPAVMADDDATAACPEVAGVVA